jgi:hypothetical protein
MIINSTQTGNVQTITIEGQTGAFVRTLAPVNSRQSNAFTNTIDTELFAKVAAFCNVHNLTVDDENTFANLNRFAANRKPIASAAQVAAWKANVKAIKAL